MSQETSEDSADAPEPAAATPPDAPQEAEPQESDFDEKILSCSSCGQDFRFSAGEQAFFAQRGFQPPRRCKPCRTKRRESGGAERRPRRPSGRAAKSRAPSAGGERKRWPATCAECGIETTVPFEPRGTKPLFCPDCYRDPRRM